MDLGRNSVYFKGYIALSVPEGPKINTLRKNMSVLLSKAQHMVHAVVWPDFY